MRELFGRIKEAANKDKAKTPEEFLLYLVEEVGEIGTVIAVNKGLKNRHLYEDIPQESVDVVISALIMITQYMSYDEFIEYMNKKISKYESNVRSNNETT